MILAEITIHVPDNEWMSQNSRMNHMALQRKRNDVKGRAIMLARSWQHANPEQAKLLERTPRVHVTAIMHMKTNGRYDPENGAPTVKAIIDGFTKAGFWPDDDYKHVVGPDYRAGEGLGRGKWRAITMRLETEDES